MPRQDVPYGGALCRLKERIAEIWDELGKKLHSINGVEGDAAGDVKIVSGDAAVVITSDQVNHQIEVALDSSQLPAASVSSVNGQTGAVALDAGDIPSNGNSDVQTDIDVNKAAISACSSAITSEQLARQNADSTLQGNINTLSASIPTAAATAVANDPTVAQLATDVPNKVDKITSGSSLKAYTHTGATQGETSVVDGTTANSIGIRDANGRMQAADPASGATDKTLVTANWVSQTGNSSPNNLVHKSGDELIQGRKTLVTTNALNAIAYSSYNHSEVSSIGMANSFRSRHYTDTTFSAYDEVFELGCMYSTATSNRVSLHVEAPRVNTGDTSEAQKLVRLDVTERTDGTCEVYLTTWDGNGVQKRKALGVFDGTNWS